MSRYVCVLSVFLSPQFNVSSLFWVSRFFGVSRFLDFLGFVYIPFSPNGRQDSKCKLLCSTFREAIMLFYETCLSLS